MNLKLITALVFGIIATQAYAADASTNTMNPSTASVSQSNTTMDVATQNQKEGEAFLMANKAKPGVVTLPTGLQYKIITPGHGPKPSATDVVTVNYSGKLINGTEFDSSAKQGGPVSFPLNQVIPGWVEALQLMPEGSTWELYIPANLAYGDQGAPPVIGPNQTLIFRVSLISMKKG